MRRFEALGVPIEVRCHGAGLDDVIAPLLAAHPAAATPVHRFDLWDESGGVTVLHDGRLLHERAQLDTAVNGLIAGVTVDAILAPRQTVLLHAGAVVHAGRAVLIGGGSGAGKTTTTVELVVGGLQFLTDEVVELDPATGRVRGLARAIGLEGPARSWHEELRPPWLDGDDDADRWAVAPMAVGKVTDHGDLSLFVDLEFTSADPPQVERLEPLQALGQLCALTFNRGQLTEPVLGQLAALVGRVPSAVVRHGGGRGAARAVLEHWGPGRATAG